MVVLVVVVLVAAGESGVRWLAIVGQVAAVLVCQQRIKVQSVVGFHGAFDGVLVQDRLDELNRSHNYRRLCLDGANSVARKGTAELVDLDRGL